MLRPQPGDQTRFVGLADLFARIRVHNFRVRSPRLQPLVLFKHGLRCIGGDCAGQRWGALFQLPIGMRLFRAPKRRQAAFLKIGSPYHHLIGMSDLIDRRNPAARDLFAVLVGRHLQLELLTVSAAFGT